MPTHTILLGRLTMGPRRTDGSKIALVHLVQQLERWGFGLIDCQMKTEHLATFGAREIPRLDFVERIRGLVDQPPVPVPWLLEPAVGRGERNGGITPR